jgi:amino acid adenylation domain-containing protein
LPFFLFFFVSTAAGAAAPPPPAGAAAYLLYTSGSTGRPKGVAVSYDALAAHLADVVREYRLEPADRVLQFAEMAFDASLETMLGPLVAGATVVLRGTELWTAGTLRRQIAERGLTVANLSPAYWDELLRDAEAAAGTGRRADWGRLRLMIVGGEELPPAALDRWRRLGGSRGEGEGGPLLLNAYGPTETVITSVVGRLTATDPAPGRRIPIGRPLGARRAWVLDRELRPVAQGIAGELWIGGSPLGRGYFRGPAATAAAFLPDPFAGEPGARMYRTGDRVRHRSDGALEFLGRADRQLELRGARVEPGEIEAALEAHPGVRRAVVVAVDGEGGDRRLVALWSAADGPPPAAGELREFLAGAGAARRRHT